MTSPTGNVFKSIEKHQDYALVSFCTKKDNRLVVFITDSKLKGVTAIFGGANKTLNLVLQILKDVGVDKSVTDGIGRASIYVKTVTGGIKLLTMFTGQVPKIYNNTKDIWSACTAIHGGVPLTIHKTVYSSRRNELVKFSYQTTLKPVMFAHVASRVCLQISDCTKLLQTSVFDPINLSAEHFKGLVSDHAIAVGKKGPIVGLVGSSALLLSLFIEVGMDVHLYRMERAKFFVPSESKGSTAKVHEFADENAKKEFEERFWDVFWHHLRQGTQRGLKLTEQAISYANGAVTPYLKLCLEFLNAMIEIFMTWRENSPTFKSTKDDPDYLFDKVVILGSTSAV